jgi:DNA-binding MarR family transcriptional regulator
LVEINPNPENKTKNIVTITDKGKNVAKEFKDNIESIETELFKKFDDEEKEKLKMMLKDIAKEYNNLN